MAEDSVFVRRESLDLRKCGIWSLLDLYHRDSASRHVHRRSARLSDSPALNVMSDVKLDCRIESPPRIRLRLKVSTMSPSRVASMLRLLLVDVGIRFY